MSTTLHSMATIQVLLDNELLKSANREARRAHLNRSALIREALRKYLKELEVERMVQRELEGYRKYPQDPAEVEAWAKVAVWPEP